MKNNLWITSCHVTHEESLNQMALSLFEKIHKTMKTLARWGYSEITINLSEMKLFTYIHPDLHEQVRERLLKILNERSFFVKICNPTDWIIYWKPLPTESKVPRLTSRDLIQAGYNPAQGSLFSDILQGLRTAILKGEVSNDTLQANLLWVKEKFPI
jgi:hypothetical protein